MMGGGIKKDGKYLAPLPIFSHFRQAVIDFMIMMRRRRKRNDIMTFSDSILNAYDEWSKIGKDNFI